MREHSQHCKYGGGSKSDEMNHSSSISFVFPFHLGSTWTYKRPRQERSQARTARLPPAVVWIGTLRQMTLPCGEGHPRRVCLLTQSWSATEGRQILRIANQDSPTIQRFHNAIKETLWGSRQVRANPWLKSHCTRLAIVPPVVLSLL